MDISKEKWSTIQCSSGTILTVHKQLQRSKLLHVDNIMFRSHLWMRHSTQYFLLNYNLHAIFSFHSNIYLFLLLP